MESIESSPLTGYDFEQSGHLKGLSPVCFSIWSLSLDWLENTEEQRSHETKVFFLKIESSSSKSSTSVIRSPSSDSWALFPISISPGLWFCLCRWVGWRNVLSAAIQEYILLSITGTLSSKSAGNVFDSSPEMGSFIWLSSGFCE